MIDRPMSPRAASSSTPRKKGAGADDHEVRPSGVGCNYINYYRSAENKSISESQLKFKQAKAWTGGVLRGVDLNSFFFFFFFWGMFRTSAGWAGFFLLFLFVADSVHERKKMG